MQMNNLWKRIVSLLTAVMFVFTSGIEAFAGASMEEALNKVNLYVKQEKGPQLLTWKGVVDAENFAPAIVAYQTEDGQELPAYCANPNRPGVEDTAAKAYEVDVDQLDTDPHVWGVITNGYPYKSPAELGVKTDYEAYYITKMAVWAIVHDNYSNLDDWKANGSQYDYVEKAMKDLVEIGRANQHVYPTWLATNPVTATAQPDGDYLIQEYEINSNANVESFRVVFDGDVPAGVKAVDENGQEKETFDGNTSKIKVMIPKTGQKQEGTFRIILKAKLENKSVMFGISHVSKQDYYVAPVPVYNGDSWADVKYLETPGSSTIDPPKVSKGLQILKVKAGTTQGLAGAVFKVVDTNGGVLGHYVTDKNGEIAIPDIPIGEYYIEEEVPPAGYVVDSNPHKDVIVTADEPAIVTFANEEMAELEVLKVDADTGEALAGAVIRVALDGGSDSYDIHTSASGKGILTNLKSGTYTVTEIAAPDGYILNQTPQSVKLEPGKKATITLTNKSKSDLVIKKYDEDTGMPLPNAEFSVAKKGGSIVYEGMTDKSGQIRLEDLDEGWYTVTEIAPPKGYLIAAASKDVYLEPNKTVEIKFDNRLRPSLQIMKIDAETGKPLAGAVFKVVKAEDKTESEYVTDATGTIVIHDLDEAIYTVTEVKAPEGYLLEEQHKDIALEWGKTKTLVFENKARPALEILKVDEETKEPLAGAKFRVTETEGNTTSEYVTDKTGKILIENLEAKIYTVEEIAAPDGYLLEEQHKDIELEWGKTKQVVFTNKAKPKLEILKIDEATKEPLSGAKFRVTETEGNTTSEYVTDKTGKILIENLEAKTYTVEEIVAPDGYLLEEQHKDIELEWGKTKQVVFTNKKRPALEILKIDEATKEPLAGAKFRVTETEGNTTSEYVTDKTGKILIENLEAKIYTVEEIAAPDGYLLEEQHKDIELEWGKMKQVVFTNKKRPALEILKIDEATKEPLAGAKFRVTETEGNTTSEYVTDKTGRILIENLEAKIYTVEEIVAPDGYLLEEQHKDIELEWGKTKQVVFTNKARPKLEILKVDKGDNNKPLAGAKFKVTETEGNTTSEYITDKDGRILIENLDARIYTVEEIAAPDGYILETQHKEIELEWGKTKTLVYENIKKPTLIITKTNGLTLKPIPNTTYKIEYEGEKGGVIPLGTYKTDKKGQIILTKREPGWHIITETIPAQGFQLPSNPVSRKYLAPGENAYTVPNEDTSGNGGNSGNKPSSNLTVTSGNDYNLGDEHVNYPLNSLVIKKTDANTSEMLEGAVFEVRKVTEDISGNSGTVIGRYRTDNSGIIVITGLEAGGYVVEEVQPPSNYLLSENSQQQAWMKADGTSIVEVVFSNYPYGNILVTKTDALTGKPLANARFKVTDGNHAAVGNSNGEYITNENGEFLVSSVKPGSYIITELEAPENYAIDTTPQAIQVGTDGGTYKVSFKNQPYSTLVILKKSSADKTPLANAEFKVTTSDGAAVGNSNGIFRTDATGTITIPNLSKGSYVIKETKAPDGYILENNSRTVHMDYGKTYTEDFENSPKASLILKKFDAETKKPLNGARFKITRKNGDIIGEYTTDSNGLIQLDSMEPGWYSAVEVKAPDGYLLNDVAQDFEVTHTKTVTLEFTNEKLTALIIKKTDDKNVPLSGAHFSVQKQDGTQIGEYTTDKNGAIHLPSLDPDWYVVREIKAPDGYLLDETPKTVQVKTETPTTVTFINKQLTALEIIKTNENGEPLAGAKFAIEKQDGQRIGEYTTDNTGHISIPTLPPDWYVVKEIKAPDGYLLDETPKTVEIKTGQPTIVDFVNKKLTALEIKKTNENGEPLAGAKFAVEKQDGQRIGEYTTDNTGHISIPTLPPDWYVVKETKAPDGYLLDETQKTVEIKTGQPTVVDFVNKKLTALEIIKTNENGEPLAGAKFVVEKQNKERIGEYTTDKAGIISIPTLPPDWYVVKEMKAPDGYLLDETPKTVEVKTGQPTVVEFVNKKLTALEIIKTNENGEPLAGAKFAVEKQDGQRIGEYTTDNTGHINIPTLPPDWYVVRETKAPDGYLLDEKPKTVEVKTGQPTVVDFVNKKLTALEIIKTNENGEPLAGAKFAVEKQDGQRIGEYTTDNTGHISIPTLPPDWYVVRETKAPDGYLLDETPKTVEIKTGQPTVVDFVNKKLTALEIIKTNENGEPLAGAKFVVEKQNKERIGEYTTDKAGIISIPTLLPDWYVVKETKAPDGYLLDETPKTVEIKTGQPTVVEFVNKKLTALEIIKTNENGEPLVGAKFAIEKQDGQRIGEYTTDNTGHINIPTLPPDWYVVRETKAPDGYLLDETPKTVEIKTGQPTVVEFVNKKLTALEIIKTNENGEPLAGAKFAVEKQDGQRIGEYTTDNTGHINIPTLPPDWYVVRETKAPDGYLLDETPKTAEVKTGQPTVVKFVNKALMSLQIKKIDEISGTPLSGAEFKVTKQNGELVGEYVTEKDGLIHIPTLEPGYYTISETKAPEGYILDSVPQTVEVVTGRPTEKTFSNKPMSGLKIIKLDSVTREPLEGVEFAVTKMNGEKIGTFKTDNTGQIYIQELEDGYYTVTEIKGIEGYHIDKEPKTVEVHWGKPTVLEITNDPFPALVIKKTSSKNDRPLEGVKFLITKFNGEEIGTYKTDESGLIIVEGLEEGQYLVKEIETRKGYQLDTEAKEVTIRNGKRTTLEVTNDPLSSIIIRKIDSVTKEGIYGVTFLLYDEKDNPLGQYMSDDEGYVWLDKELEPGKYKLRELKPADGYLPDDVPRTIYVKSGQTTEIIWENTPQKGQIVITKRAADFNELTGLPAGSPLAGASFEVYNTTGNLVDKFVSDSRGIAASKQLPLGVYVVKEVSAPRYYAVNSRELLAEIRHNGDIVRFEVLNESSSLQLTIQKKGPNSAAPGQTIQYELYEIANKSSVALENFYIHDRIPTDATRALKVVTGTYSERMYYSITFKTNYRDYRVLAENLLTKNSYEYSLHPNALGLEAGEYVTDVRLEFPKASPGFHSIENMMVFCQVMPTVPKDYNIVNRADNGGRYGNEWESSKTSWNTTVWTTNTPSVPLPKTGY